MLHGAYYLVEVDLVQVASEAQRRQVGAAHELELHTQDFPEAVVLRAGHVVVRGLLERERRVGVLGGFGIHFEV